jgi:hypothetical protein
MIAAIALAATLYGNPAHHVVMDDNYSRIDNVEIWLDHRDVGFSRLPPKLDSGRGSDGMVIHRLGDIDGREKPAGCISNPVCALGHAPDPFVHRPGELIEPYGNFHRDGR